MISRSLSSELELEHFLGVVNDGVILSSFFFACRYRSAGIYYFRTSDIRETYPYHTMTTSSWPVYTYARTASLHVALADLRGVARWFSHGTDL